MQIKCETPIDLQLHTKLEIKLMFNQINLLEKLNILTYIKLHLEFRFIYIEYYQK